MEDNRDCGRNCYWNLKLQLKEKKEKKREYIKHSYMNLSKEGKEKKRI